MKILKWYIPFGMISVLFFFTHTILGSILWHGYSPIRQNISELTADGSPHAHLLRVFVGIYEVCFLVFALGMIFTVFRKHNVYIKTGFSLLLLSALFSIVGFNTFPMTAVFIISLQNLGHVVVTIILLCATIISVTLISAGYLKHKKRLGRLLLFTAIISALFNPIFWYAVTHGFDSTGLIERITVYPFHVFTFAISWQYSRLLLKGDKDFISVKTQSVARQM